MRRWYGYAMAGLLLLGLGFAMVWSLQLERKPVRSSANISVVVYGADNSDRWKSLNQGIQQACSELGIETPVLIYTGDGTPDRQLRRMQREVENGSKGLLVAVTDAQIMEEFLSRLPAGVAAVAVESGANESIKRISADDRIMGREMADAANQAEGTVALLREHLERDSVALRYEGFMERMEELDREVIVLERDDDDELLSFLASSLAVYSPSLDNLVLLENETLEVAVDALPAAMVEARLFGIGNSSKVVHALDQGVLDTIVFQNEYAVGYIGVMELAEALGLVRMTEWEEIQYRVVSRDSMYEPEMERLLFPIIQ